MKNIVPTRLRARDRLSTKNMSRGLGSGISSDALVLLLQKSCKRFRMTAVDFTLECHIIGGRSSKQILDVFLRKSRLPGFEWTSVAANLKTMGLRNLRGSTPYRVEERGIISRIPAHSNINTFDDNGWRWESSAGLPVRTLRNTPYAITTVPCPYPRHGLVVIDRLGGVVCGQYCVLCFELTNRFPSSLTAAANDTG